MIQLMRDLYCTVDSLLCLGCDTVVNHFVDDTLFVFGIALGMIHHITDQTEFGCHVLGRSIVDFCNNRNRFTYMENIIFLINISFFSTYTYSKVPHKTSRVLQKVACIKAVYYCACEDQPLIKNFSTITSVNTNVSDQVWK